jgi:hypothetical protein
MENQVRNPFQRLKSELEVPPEIKEKLMKEIRVLQLVGAITDLFSAKMGQTAMALLKRDKNINH